MIRYRVFALMALMVLEAANASRIVFAARNPAEANLQNFLDSDVDTLIIPSRPGGWETGPLRITRNKRVLILLPGCELRARPGAFSSSSSRLLTLDGVEDVKLLGYGASLVMAKNEYSSGEWRHALSLIACSNVRIEGLRIDSSGGDGIYVAGGPKGTMSRDILVSHCRLGGHRRQGISVISAEGFRMEHCFVENTEGTEPEAGLDFEPNRSDESIVNCRIRNIVFRGNRGSPAKLYMSKLTEKSQPISVAFSDCLFAGTRVGPGVEVMELPKDGRKGKISFRRCQFEDSAGPALTTSNKGLDAAGLEFTHCQFSVSDTRPGIPSSGIPIPILSFRHSRSLKSAWAVGGIDFVDCIMGPGPGPLYRIENGVWRKAREIRIQAFLPKDLPFLPEEGAAVAVLSRRPDWAPPPPLLQEFIAAASGGCEAVLGNWAGDSLSFSLGGQWRTMPWGTRVRLEAGQLLLTVSRRGGIASDTLSWRTPAYLKPGFAEQNL